ncbi:hypothetical protein ACWEQL_00020 [Kitasatospora sp. NPDC004240]
MDDFTPAPNASSSPGTWQPLEVLSQQDAEEFARTVTVTRHAQREYMAAHTVSEVTAVAEVRRLLERFLQVGRLARDAGGIVRARSPKADGEVAYSFLLDLATRHVLGYSSPGHSWFDDAHVPLEDLRRDLADRRRREQERQQRRAANELAQQQRRVAHEQRMRVQEQEAAARRAAALPVPTWPLLPDGYYDRRGNPAPEPVRRRPITNEARIRHVARLPHVVFHAEALNSPYFRNVPVEHRCEALHRVLDRLMRAPTKGAVAIGRDAITLTGRKVTMTLSPDCATVRTLNPPRPGKDQPPTFHAKDWPKVSERPFPLI